MSYELALKERYTEARGRLGMPYGEPSYAKAPPRPYEAPKAFPERERDYLLIAGSYVDPEDEPPSVPSVPVAPWRVILSEVARKHKLTVTQIVGQQRSHPIVLARHEAMYRMAHETRMSLPQIGQRLGGRDHSTCFHGIRMHAERNGILAFNGGAKPNHLQSVQRAGVIVCQ